MNRVLLRNILASQREDLQLRRSKAFISRELDLSRFLADEEITIVSGVRRCGKSSLVEQFLYTAGIESFLYLNFEDPQLAGFSPEDFLLLYEIWVEDNPKHAKRIAYFDEIQNVVGWEPWMNFFANQKRFKVFITGSNSNLLSKELGTHLTGRYRQVTLYPLSFKELLLEQEGSRNIESYLKGAITIEAVVKFEKLVKEYIDFGGFPRAWIPKETSILSDYYSNIINRDIIRRKSIRSPLPLEKLGSSIMGNIGRKINKTKLAQSIGLKNGDTVEKYLSHFEECYLGFQIRKYDKSIRKQLRNQTKFYSIDTAMAQRVAMPSDSKSTYYLENLVLLELLRRGNKVYYWQAEDEIEVDFVVETPDKKRQLIQVSWSVNEEKTLDREIRGIESFVKENKNLKIEEALIITFERFKLKQSDAKKNIKIVPFYLWALSK